MKFKDFIIFSSLKHSFSAIWKNKLWFFLLFALEIIFLAVFGYINTTYGIKIVESSKAIDEYISQQQLDEVSVAENILQQKSILGDNPLSISRNFNEIVRNFRLYLIYSFISLVIFTSASWAFTYRLIHKITLKNLIKNFTNALVISSFCYGLIFAFFYSLTNISLADAEGTKLLAKYIPFFIFSLVLAYFMFVALSLLNNSKLSDIVQKTLRIGIKKIHYVLAAYFLNILFFIFSAFLFFYFLDRNLFLLLMSIFLMIFSLVLGRIFMVNVVEKIEKL